MENKNEKEITLLVAATVLHALLANGEITLGIKETVNGAFLHAQEFMRKAKSLSLLECE